MDKDIKQIRIINSKSLYVTGFVVEISYINGKSASLYVEGWDLENVFSAIDRQNKEVHRGMAKRNWG